MGSSSSCLSSLDNLIYICYNISDKENEEKYHYLFDQLEKENFTIVTSKDINMDQNPAIKNYNVFLENMNDLVHNVPFIIVCLDEHYLNCVQQIKELNKILERENNILYLKMNENNTNTIFASMDLKGLIKKNECLILRENNMEKIMNLVKSK